MLLKVLLLVSFLQAVESDSSCSKANWWSSFDRKGWSYCANNKHFITGFYRSKLGSWNRDEIYRLEEARCCPSIRRYRSQRSQCVNANWWSSLDKTGTWSSCPSGYFLNGLYRTSGNNLHNIEEGKCCKPIHHPPYYGQCYDEDIRHKFDKAGWTQCEKAGYFVTAVFRDTGTDWLHNVDKLRCCQMGILRQSCFDANWWSSFDHKGWSTCGDNKLFVTGFYRSRLGSWNKDEIYRLEEARCCPSIPRYGNQNSQCINANWWSSLDKRGTWSKCPSGYFLNGLYRTSGNNLHNIEEGKCCKPQHHPNQHGHCYPEDIRQQFDKAGWTVCTRAGHFVAGVYRDTGTDWLHNVDKLWCCQMK